MSNAKVYAIITDKMVKRIEEAIKNGTEFKWVKPWKGYPLGNYLNYLKDGDNMREYKNYMVMEMGLTEWMIANFNSYDNSKGKTAVEKTYYFSEKTSRSMGAGASVGTILGAEVRASLGGDASYSRTQSYTYKVIIPAGKIGHIYVSEKTSLAKFRHVIQPQIKDGQIWKNLSIKRNKNSN